MEQLNKNKIKMLPKEVLDFFPIWEYQCPKCGAYLGYEPVEYCVKCGARFTPEQARVPPRFLKNYKAMSEFAHKVLAPKLTEKQRQLLFKYFTTIFEDGFESGDFSAWTGTDGSPSVQSSVVNSGSYAMQVDALYDAWVGVYKDVGTQTTTFFRAYVRFTSVPDADGERLRFMHLGTTTSKRTFVQIRYVTDHVEWQLWEYDDGANWHSASSSTPTFNANQWYCVEVKRYCAGGTGEVRLYVDGTEIASITGLDNDAYTTSRIACEAYGASGWYPTVYYDDVVVADTYIGPISEATTYTITWQADTLFKKLGISKIFTVDSALRKKIQTFKSIDSLFKKPRVLKQFGVNTEFLERNITKSFSVDSRLGAVTTHMIQKYTDALLQKSDITKMFNADVYFKKSREAQAQINTLFLKTSTVQKNFDVSLQKTETKTLSLDVWFGTAAPTAHTKIFGVKTMFRYRVELPTPLGITLDGQLVIPLKREVWIGNKS